MLPALADARPSVFERLLEIPARRPQGGSEAEQNPDANRNQQRPGKRRAVNLDAAEQGKRHRSLVSQEPRDRKG